MTTAQEFLDKEAASWAAFEIQIARVPADSREAPGVVGEWTLKDVVWHCAHWARFAAEYVASAPEGSFSDPFDSESDEHWDGVNAEIAAVSSAMSWDDVRTGTEEARDELRRVIADRGDQVREATAWAADESWVHYDEHALEVRAFADGLG
jgi:hypothetical protein